MSTLATPKRERLHFGVPPRPTGAPRTFNPYHVICNKCGYELIVMPWAPRDYDQKMLAQEHFLCDGRMIQQGPDTP